MSPPPNTSKQPVMNYVLRLVIPVKREFGISLDVPQFMADRRYATEILNQVKGSTNPELLKNVAIITELIGISSPSNPILPNAQVEVTPPAAVANEAAPPQKIDSSLLTPEEEARQIMMAKYKSGLR